MVNRIIALNTLRIAQNTFYHLRYEAAFNEDLKNQMKAKQLTHDIIADKEEKSKSKKTKKNKGEKAYI